MVVKILLYCMLNLRGVLYYFEIYLINNGWIRIRMDPELGKFKAGSRSGINHSGSTTLELCDIYCTDILVDHNH